MGTAAKRTPGLEALRDSSRDIGFLEAFLEHLPDMVFVKDAEELRFVYVNPAAEALIGISRSKLIGKTDFDLFPQAQAEDFVNADRRVLASRETMTIEGEPLQTPTGIRWLDTRKVVILGDDGEPKYLLGVSRDVTVEQEAVGLRASIDELSRQRFAILSQLAIGVVVADVNGRLTIQNKAAEDILGLIDYEGLLPEEWSDKYGLFHTDGKSRWLTEDLPLYRALHGEVVKHVEMIVRNENRPEGRHLSVNAQPLVGDDGETLGAVAVFEDISMRKVHEVQTKEAEGLRRANEALQKFASLASHDLRSPLRAIENLALWIEEDGGDQLPESVRGHLATIKDRVRLGMQLIDDLLEYTRELRRGHVVETVEVDSVVKDAWDIQDRPKDAQLVVAGTMPTIKTARAQLEAIFRNLFQNAIKHSDRKDCEVTVRAEDTGTYIAFSVDDNGKGIAPAFRARVFDPHTTLDAKSEGRGSGFGLAIVKGLVTAVGGSVAIESAPSGGASFRFTWPKELAFAIISNGQSSPELAP